MTARWEGHPRRVFVLSLLAGLAVAVLLTSLTHGGQRAEETLVVVRGSDPVTDVRARSFAATARSLATRSVVLENVARALGLQERDVRGHVYVTQQGSSAALSVTADAPTATAAVRLVQQFGVVLAELVANRFAPLALSPFDPPHSTGAEPRPWGRNLGVGALFGVLAGAGLAAVKRQRRPREASPNVAAITRQRHPRTAVVQPTPAGAAEPEPPTNRSKAPVVARPAEVRPRADGPRAGAPTLAELRQLVDAARTTRPERVDEWETYLTLLEEHAGVDGALSAAFDGLVEEVFGSLLN
jgi:capsular polysaccharide biosynthesis protein